MCIDGEFSEESYIFSVGQGYILGPLLCIVFVNDLPNFLLADLFIYADYGKKHTSDTGLFFGTKKAKLSSKLKIFPYIVKLVNGLPSSWQIIFQSL